MDLQGIQYVHKCSFVFEVRLRYMLYNLGIAMRPSWIRHVKFLAFSKTWQKKRPKKKKKADQKDDNQTKTDQNVIETNTRLLWSFESVQVTTKS